MGGLKGDGTMVAASSAEHVYHQNGTPTVVELGI